MLDSAYTPGPRAAGFDHACRIVEFREWPNSSSPLIGHADVPLPTGIDVHRVPVFRRAEGLSIGVPYAVQVDAEGRVRMKAGKRQYVAMLSFTDKEARKRWQNAVLAALADAGVGGAA